MSNSNPIYRVTDTELTAVASAIRAKTGATASISYPGGFIDEINSLGSKPYTLEDVMAKNMSTISLADPVITLERIPNYYFYSFKSLNFDSNISFPVCSYIGSFAFYSCSSLTEASFPACSYIGSYAFTSCFSLSKLSFPACSYLDYGAFQTCTSLTEISFPACSYINNYVFQNCFSLTTANFPACSYIGNYAFQYCSSLTEANFPACSYIGSYAFQSCYSLTTVDFPACSFIGGSAFQSCHSLTVASFPACSYISGFAFRYCRNLISLYLMSTSVVLLSNSATFSSTPIGGYTTTAGIYGSVYVPQSLYSSYITATNWTYYSNRIVGL